MKEDDAEVFLDGILDEIGITQENIIHAFHRLKEEGIIMAEFKK